MTFKRITLSILLILVLSNLLLVYHTLLKPAQVVYVDTNRLLEHYEGMKAARQAFQQKTTQWQANIDTLRSEWQRAVSAHEASKATMSKKEQQLSEELLRTKQQQLVEYQQGIRQQSQQEDQQMTERVLTEVNTFIASYGKKKGYTIILGATSVGNIIYARDRLDITEELQAALNDNYQGF